MTDDLEASLPTFHEWLLTAPTGDSIVYYIGNLVQHRGDVIAVPPRASRNAALDDADAAWLAFTNGLVTLVQRASPGRRSNDSHEYFEYIAQRTSKARRADPPV